MDLLLRKSGFGLTGSSNAQLNDDVEKMILDVVENRINFEQLVDWFLIRIGKQ